jgi:secretion/DNA translocation related TadE-like protein
VNRAAGERGSASVAVIGLLAALLITAIAAIGACALLGEKQRVSAAADAAALAAADAASGRVAGVPCERAGLAARLNGAELASCQIDGPFALVSARRQIGGVPIAVWARAGPPKEPGAPSQASAVGDER